MCIMLRACRTHPTEHASLISAQLDSWQLSFKYSNSPTEFPGDSVAQLVRAWQAIWAGHVFESLPESLSFFPLFSRLYFSPFFLTDFDLG